MNRARPRTMAPQAAVSVVQAMANGVAISCVGASIRATSTLRRPGVGGATGASGAAGLTGIGLSEEVSETASVARPAPSVCLSCWSISWTLGRDPSPALAGFSLDGASSSAAASLAGVSAAGVSAAPPLSWARAIARMSETPEGLAAGVAGLEGLASGVSSEVSAAGAVSSAGGAASASAGAGVSADPPSCDRAIARISSIEGLSSAIFSFQ